MGADVPYFVRMRGCINCVASKRAKADTGFDYVFVHENILCLAMDCFHYGHELHRPYIDPAEWVRLAKVKNNPEFTGWVRKTLSEADEVYRGWFEKVGISVEALLLQLDSK